MNISRPLTDADLIRKAERSGERFLAAQALHDGWAGAKSYGLPLGLNADATLVFGERIERAHRRAVAELYRDLSRLGEPVEVAGKRLRIDTETESIVIFNA